MTSAGPRRRGVRSFLVLGLIAALVGTGIALYLNERDSRQESRQLGGTTAAAWVEAQVVSQEVSATNQELTLYTVLVPHGTLAAAPDSLEFTRAVDVTVTSLTTTTLHVTAGQAAQTQALAVGMFGGTASDYPFDHYRLSVGWEASEHGTPVPVTLMFTDADPFFVVRPDADTGAVGELTVLDARVSRSRSTFILAWFMIAAMWALALAVLGGAEVLIRKRQGLVWPALGWMAATLFALVGLRNAAPGSPPIGCLMDYVAFFWAEGIIAAGLTCTAAFGIRAERHAMAD
ncbi:DUF4436 domain-containing protein [Kitasatospora nipponensis]|uniref:DUF4436 domain-containing protein n=1 Tax=Kitasatospora nipponensis TaxID=258049 RepID=A0ABN1VY60_9ACTN